MKILSYSIIGSGLSALIRDQISKGATIFCTKKTRNIKINYSNNFFEVNSQGGNTNIWGGYINIKKHNIFLKKKKYFNFFKKNNLFKIEKLILNNSIQQTSYIKNINDSKIFRIRNENFKNKFNYTYIKKIKVFKNFIKIFGKKNFFMTKKLDICAGNLGLIEILYNSNLIKKKDIISFEDGKVSYKLNIAKNYKKNYYIPMKISEIFLKLIFKKTLRYDNKSNNFLILQTFQKKSNKFKFQVDEILNQRRKLSRYFLSNHLVKLKINDIYIDQYISNISKRIKIFNSGKLRRYHAGPISQEIIFNAINEN